MGSYNQNWEEIGRNIQSLVDEAVRSQDYQKLNQAIRQTVSKAVDLGGTAVKNVVDTTARSASAAGTARHTEAKTVTVESRNLPALYGSANGKTVSGVLKVVGGSLLSLFTFFGFLSTAFVRLFTGSSLLSFSVIAILLGFSGGVALLSSGIRTLGMVGRFNTYKRILGQKTYCALDKLARSVGKSAGFVRKELSRMIDDGLFLEGHMDKEGRNLITSDETYRNFERSRLALEQRQKEEAKAQAAAPKAQPKPETKALDPQVQEVLDRGNEFLRQIRKCNDAIPGEEISGKISRIELIVRRIFQRAQVHPEIIPDLKKMMDYYLPMTVKLLNAYADMDAQPVQGETIQASKREIEDTLDTLNLAFEKLLDSVFQDTAMDVSSDISVLQTLLAQEGLVEDELTKLKKQNQSEG